MSEPSGFGIPGAITDTWDLTAYPHMADWLGATHELIDDTYGHRTYRFVKNSSVSSIAAALVVGTTDEQTEHFNVSIAPVSASREECRGVTIGAIPAGYGGWVVKTGQALVTADGSTAVTKNTPIMVGAADAGTVQTGAVGTNSICGYVAAASNIAVDATGIAIVDFL